MIFAEGSFSWRRSSLPVKPLRVTRSLLSFVVKCFVYLEYLQVDRYWMDYFERPRRYFRADFLDLIGTPDALPFQHALLGTPS